MSSNTKWQTEVPENITVTEGRFFINISLRGCGSGCLYCYVDGFKDQQVLLDENTLIESLVYLEQLPEFVPGPRGTLLSLCPDTEPFKTAESTRLISSILKRLLPLGNPIQIPTKEKVPYDVLSLIAKERTYWGQFILFVSTSTITRASIIEPSAAPPAQRFENFLTCKHLDIPACLYIKPFLRATLNDLPLYIDVISNYQPAMGCVGILYKAKSSRSDPELQHPAHPELHSEGLNDAIVHFREELARRSSIRIFYSSICVSAYARKWFPFPKIWSDLPNLCIQCRSCEEDYQAWRSEHKI